jgi:hypothetical protein
MSLVPTPSQPQAIAANQTSPRPPSSRKQGIKQSPEFKVSTVLRSVNSSMERGAPEYTQSGLPSPYPSNFGDTQSEASSADQAPAAAAAAPAPYTAQQESRSNYSTSATPTSDYSVFPQSARSGSFPEHIQRPYHPASSHAGSTGGMAQTPSPSSVPVPDGRSHQNPPQGTKSDSDVPIDPSIAAPSPTYATHSQYSPYAAPPQDMGHNYPHPGSAGLYAQPRPDWTGYGQQHPSHLPPGHHPFPPNTASGPPQSRPSQVGSPLVRRWCRASSNTVYSSHGGTAPTGVSPILTELWLTHDFVHRSTHSCPFQERNSIRDHAVAMRRLNACTSAVGMVARRRMEL